MSFCHQFASVIRLFVNISCFKLVLNTEQETKLSVMFPISSRTSIVTLALIRQKHCHHMTLKFRIGQSLKNLLPRTAEGIGMKLGT